jgi:hypothetical protein
MENDSMDNLLEEFFTDNHDRIYDISQIKVTDMNIAAFKLKKSFYIRKHPIIKTWVPHGIVKGFAAAACIMVTSVIVSIAFAAQVQAVKGGIVKSISYIKNNVFTIEFSGTPSGKKTVNVQQPKPESELNNQEIKKMTLSEAKEELPFHLFIPGYVPDGYTFSQLTCTKYSFDNTYMVEQTYHRGETGVFVITQTSSQYDNFKLNANYDLSHGEKIEKLTVMGQEASLVGSQENCSITWFNDNFKYTLSGTISMNEAKKVLKSLK